MIHYTSKKDFVSIHSFLTFINKQIKALIDKTAVHADWLNNTNLKKKLAYDLMKLLYKNGYPPRWNQEIFDKVLDQVEHFRTYN